MLRQITGAVTTIRPGGAINRAMARLLGILIAVSLLISLGIGAAAHAGEQICLPGMEAAGAVGHTDGDADQSRDAETGYPHHHGGCHGHHVAAPVDGASTGEPGAQLVALTAGTSRLVALAPTGAALRPPIA